MNKEEPYRDQAERLKRRIEKINDRKERDLIPPREQVHRQRKTKTKLKLKYPVIRLLVLIFILLPIIIFSVISYLDGKKVNGTVKTTGDSVGYEEINLEKPKKEEVKNKTDRVEKQEDTEQEPGASILPKQQKNDLSTENQPENKNISEQNTGTNAAVSSENVSENSNKETTGTTTSGITAAPKTIAAPKTTKIIYHTVQPKETLYRIAMKYYHSQKGINKIKQANHLQNNQIVTGQVLKIPIDN